MSRQITITDFLTDTEIERARQLYRKWKDSGQFADRVAAELIQPNMKRINRQLGQENDAKYLAYAVEYVLSQSER